MMVNWIIVLILMYVNQKIIKTFSLLIITSLVFLGVLSLLGATLPNIDIKRSILLSSGYMGFFYLCVSLIIGPLARITKKPFFLKLVPHRRNVGVMSFLLVSVHLLFVFLFTFKASLLDVYFHNIDGSMALRTGWHGISIILGSLAFLGLLLLALTSFNYSVKFLGSTLWKNIHRFVYIIFILSVVHIIIFRFVPQRPWMEDYLFYSLIILIILVIIFQFIGFIKTRKMFKSAKDIQDKK